MPINYPKIAGYKATLPRLRILELFENCDTRHLSAENVYEALLQKDIHINPTTVYRVLVELSQAGVLLRHRFEDDKTKFELKQGDHHDHLLCIQCGHIEEFYDEAIEKHQIVIAQERGFSIPDHILHIYADCTKTNCPYQNQPKMVNVRRFK